MLTREDIIEKLREVLPFLKKEFGIKKIGIFGSFTTGIQNKSSDIDIFIQAKVTNLDLDKFERKLKHSINVFFEDEIEKLSAELLNNIVNGVKLRGFLKVK